MNTLTDKILTARHQDGHIVITLQSGIEIKFPVSGNRRLRHGTHSQLNRIEVSPMGLHWPDLDEDLSLRGLYEGNYGQE